jgi:hypothetical protein
MNQAFPQRIRIHGTGPQNLCRAGVIQQGQQKVLNGDELMSLLAGLDKGHVQTDF